MIRCYAICQARRAEVLLSGDTSPFRYEQQFSLICFDDSQRPSLDEHQELAVPNVNGIMAAEQKMHERHMLQGDW